MPELIERKLLSHSLSQHLVQGLHGHNVDLEEAMKGYDSSAYLRGFEYAMNLSQTIVCNQAAAYDVEKVVEQLLDDYVKNGGMFLYEEVIETVRKGGVK